MSAMLFDGQKDTVLEFLVRNLSQDDLDSGALARINTAAYRIHKDLGTEFLRRRLSTK